MRRVTVVIGGGDLGAAIARACALEAGIAWLGYVHRRGATVQCYALTSTDDTTARPRWAAACKAIGLSVVPAPWE
jgi:hypothetical protein